MNEEPKMCTTSGRPVDVVRSEQTEAIGQHKDYIVLCPDERAKGFVRPFRDKYQHVGRQIKGEPRELTLEERQSHTDDSYVAFVPNPDFESGKTAITGTLVTQKELDRRNGDRYGGCGVVTTMGRDLSETYARDPKFYGATFCCGCNRHLPVGEFIWTKDGETVGS